MAASLPAGGRSAVCVVRLGVVHRRQHRLDRHARPHALQAVDDDLLAGLQPGADDAQAVDERPERDRRGTRSSGPASTTKTKRLSRSVPTARSWISSAAIARRVPGSRSRTNRPGVRLPSALRKTARPRIVPVAGSSWLSRKFELALARELVVAGQRHANRLPPTRARCRAALAWPAARSAGRSARRRRSARRSDRATRRVVSSVASPGPLDTRLPSVTMARPTRPVIGAVTA